MAISPQHLTIYLYSAHRAVIFAIAQLSCNQCYWYWVCCFIQANRQSSTTVVYWAVLHTFVVDQELGRSSGRCIERDVYTAGTGQIDRRQSSLSSADDSPVINTVNVISHCDQWIGTSCRQRLPADFDAPDGCGRLVDGEVDEGEVDSLMWLDTEQSWSLGGGSFTPYSARYDSSLGWRCCDEAVVWRKQIHWIQA